ncbi:MAG TPA: hypothetical protein VFW42_05360 [Fluviicoccus sp.]|nr:hypothetical protein [Fluviicoccus sp.]
MNRALIFVFFTFLFSSPSAHAWRLCEILHIECKKIEPPKQACKQLGLPCVDVIDGIKHPLTEAQAQIAAPLLAEWLQQSRESSLKNSQPMPENVKSALRGFYKDDILNSVRYTVGDNGLINLGRLSTKGEVVLRKDIKIVYGDAAAITLVDVIVFKGKSDADNLLTWAHELKHVEQFRNKGVREFSIIYLRDLRHEHNPLENEARYAANNFSQWQIDHPH